MGGCVESVLKSQSFIAGVLMKFLSPLTFLLLVIASVATLGTQAVAQDIAVDHFFNSLEKPYQPTLPQMITQRGGVKQIGYETQPNLIAPLPGVDIQQVSAVATAQCLPDACHSRSCSSSDTGKSSWLEKKTHSFFKKCYFKNHQKHKKFLYPIQPPYCQPGYGVHETCWRTMEPNRCCRQQVIHPEPIISSQPTKAFIPDAPPALLDSKEYSPQ